MAWHQYSGPGSSEYFYEVSLGRVPGAEPGFIVGINPDTVSDTYSTVSDQGGDYEYLTADAQLYISSTDALDVSVDIVIQGLDDQYAEITRTVTTNGQNQVAASGLMFRIHALFVSGSVTPVGEIYLAESDTLTGGIPDTAAKIKGKIPLSTDVDGAIVDTGTIYASDNFSHLGLYTVPAGKTMVVTSIVFAANKDGNIRIGGRIRPPGGAFVWFNRNPVFVYQSNILIPFDPPVILPEKFDFEFRAISGAGGGIAQVQVIFILEDN